MSSELKLAFGKIKIEGHGEEINVIDFFNNALEITKPEKLSSKSSTILSFLEPKIITLEGEKCLLGYYAYALGNKYQIISEDKTISESAYPIPPYKSKSLFLILGSGYILFEKKSDAYIEPNKIREALKKACRAYKIEVPVEITFLTLLESLDTMVEFINSLQKLTFLEFTNLRHSNPAQVSEYFDEATDANIDTISESSKKPEGIDRNHPEIKKQLAHSKKYGTLRKAVGEADDGIREMELVENQIDLTVPIENNDDDLKIHKMYRVFKEIYRKLVPSK